MDELQEEDLVVELVLDSGEVAWSEDDLHQQVLLPPRQILAVHLWQLRLRGSPRKHAHVSPGRPRKGRAQLHDFRGPHFAHG